MGCAVEMRRLSFRIGSHATVYFLPASRIPHREYASFKTDILEYTELILSDHRYIGAQRRHCQSVKLSTLPSRDEPLWDV